MSTCVGLQLLIMAPRSSERTKAAILSAARDRFAAVGFEAATIRAIAADAGIDPAMVMRYSRFVHTLRSPPGNTI